jgi:hypothetical protein
MAQHLHGATPSHLPSDRGRSLRSHVRIRRACQLPGGKEAIDSTDVHVILDPGSAGRRGPAEQRHDNRTGGSDRVRNGRPGRHDGFAAPMRKGTDLARADGLVGDILTTVQQTEHLHGRPTWECRTCGDPWPCANAKAALAAEFRGFPSVLAIYMTAQLHDALRDLTANGAEAPPDLYDRFLAWITR